MNRLKIRFLLPYLILTAVAIAALCAALTFMSTERQTAEAATTYFVSTVGGEAVGDGGFTNQNVVITYTNYKSVNYSYSTDGTFPTSVSTGVSSGTILSAEGNYYITMVFSNNLKGTYQYTIDKTAPTLSLSGVTNGGLTNSNVTLSWSVAVNGPTSTALANSNDTVTVKIYIDGDMYTQYKSTSVSATTSCSLSISGNYTVTVTDTAGNSNSYTFTIDQTAPTLSFSGINYTSGSSRYTNKTFTVNASDNNALSALYYKSPTSSTYTKSGSASSVTISSNSGNGLWYFYCVDTAGNQSSTYSVYLDTAAPTVNLYAGGSSISSGSYVNTSNTSATASDSGSGVNAIYYKSDSGGYASYASGTLLTAEAVYTFYCTDLAGNQSAEYTVTLDYTAPQLTFTGINYTNGTTLYTNTAFSFTVSDFTTTTISCKIDGGSADITPGTSWASDAPTVDVGTGYAFTVTDQAGNSTSYTVYVLNRSTFGNVDEINASFTVGTWYETTLPSKYFASNAEYPSGTYYFTDYASAYAYALAAELSRATATSNGWSYSSTANASTFVEYTDYATLYAAAEYYAATRVSDRKIMSQSGKGGGNDDGSLTAQELTCPSLLSDYAEYSVYYVSKNYAFTQPAAGVTGNTRYAYAQYLSDGYSLRIGGEISLTYETKLQTVLDNADCYYQGYYLITEYDICGNIQKYIVYLDLEAPALTVAVTYGNGTEENITYTEDYIASYSGIMRYTSLAVNSIADNIDSWTFIVLEGKNLSATYLYSDDLPVLSYENGYYGAYTITVYDRSANALSFSVSIAGEDPSITTSSLTNETRVRVTVTINDSNNVLTQIHLYKISYDGVYTELAVDDDGTAVTTSTLVYTLRTGGKYAVVVVDAYGRTIDSGAFFYMKDLPSGTLSGVSNGGLTNGDVSFKYANSYSVIIYIYSGGGWVLADTALYSESIGSSYTTISISASESTCFEYLIFLYVTDDMNLFVEYTFEIDCIAPTVTVMTAETGEISQDSVTRYAFYVTWSETDLTVRYATTKNALTTTKYTKNSYLTSAGTYYFTVTDAAGNQLTFEIVIDNTVSYTLTGTYTEYAEGYVSQKSLTLTVNEQIGSWECVSDNGLSVVNGQTVTANGIYQITVTDIYGNTLALTLIIDNLAPDPVITAEDGTGLEAGSSVNKPFNVTCAESGATITYSSSGVSYVAYSGDYLSAAGTHYFRISDKYGNYATFTVTCDYTVKYSVSGDYSLINDVYYISKTSLTLTVNETYVSFSVLSENGTTFASGEKVTAEGVYIVTITDAAGNVVTVTLEIDKTAPEPVITTEDGEPLEAGGSVNKPFAVTCAESSATITYSTNGTSYSAYDGAYLSTVNVYYFRITDVAGNKTEFTVTCDYTVKYSVSGDYNIIYENYYISKTSLTLKVSETYTSFLVTSESGATFTDGEKITAEGVYLVTITDAAGNVVTVTLEIDKTAPTPTITTEDGEALEAGSRINKAFAVTCAEYGATITYSAGGTSYVAYSGAYLSAANTYSFRLTDLAGNRTEFTVTCDYTVKYTVSGTYNTVEDDYYISKTSLALTVNETYVSFSVLSENGVTFAAGEKVTAEGVYLVTITDAAGNVVTVTLEIDKTAPEITLIGVSEGGVATNAVTVAFSDDVAESYYSLGGVRTALEGGSELTADGAYIITVTDRAGNKTTASFTIDATVDVTISRELFEGQIITGEISFTFNEKLTSSLTKDGAAVKYSGGKITETGVYTLALLDAYGNTAGYAFTIVSASAQSYALNAGGYDVQAFRNGALYAAAVQGDEIILADDGEYTLTFTAADGSEFTLALTVDSVLPTVEISQTKTSVVISNPSKTVTVALYKDGEEVSYKLGEQITDTGDYTLIVCDELGNSNTYYFTISYVNGYGIAVIGIACSAAAGIGFALILYRKKRSVR